MPPKKNKNCKKVKQKLENVISDIKLDKFMKTMEEADCKLKEISDACFKRENTRNG